MIKHSESKLTQLRLDAGFANIKDAAEKLNVTPKYLGQVEIGNQMPGIKLAMRIADLYGCTLDDVYRDYFNMLNCNDRR